MATYVLGALIRTESSNAGKLPRPVGQGHSASIAAAPSNIELDQIDWGHRLNGPINESAASETSVLPPRQLEASPPPTPVPEQAVDARLQSATYPARNKGRLAAGAVVFLTLGMNDAVLGALIPYIETQYDIGYAVASLLFITYAGGVLLAAPMLHAIDARLGRSRTYMLSSALMSAGFAILSSSPPYPAVVCAFLLNGYGLAMYLASANSWIVNLTNGTVILSFMHGLYGIGGICSPLIATAMVSKGIRWSYFYFVPLSLSLMSILSLGWTFRGFEAELSEQRLAMVDRTASHETAVGEPSKLRVLLQSLQNRTTLLGSLFIFFYQGSEVAISGWVISYLITYRGGNPKLVGNVTAGFWGGITLGRFVITPLTRRLGEKATVLGLVAAAAACQVVVWAVPDIIGDAVAESTVGFFLGPVYPCSMALFSKLWPRSIQISGLSLVASMGCSGGALVPFVTGLLASKLSTVVLHPIVLFGFGVMTAAWLLLPKVARRTE